MSVEEQVAAILRKKSKTLALAESCTGGALAARLTALAGASDYFLGSVVSYSNAWKQRFLGVKSLGQGAVSRDVVEEMVQGVLQAGADYAIAVTGIAGPTGGEAQTPVGTVYIGVGEKGHIEVEHMQFSGDRRSVVQQAVDAALAILLRRIT